MNKSIQYYVECFFENVYFSEEVCEVKEKVIRKINDEYEIEKKVNTINAFEVIVQKYNNLESMVKCFGYDASSIDKWFNKEITVTLDEFNEMLSRKKKYIYFITILGIFSIENFVNSLLYSKACIPFIIFSIFFLVLDIVVIKNFNGEYENEEDDEEKEEEKELKEVIKGKMETKEILPLDAQPQLKYLFDKYSKISLIWLFLFFIKLYYIILNIIGLNLNEESERFELVEEMKKMSLIFEIILFFFIKNALIMRWLVKKIDYEKTTIFKKSMSGILIFSVVYLVLSVIINYESNKIFVFNLSVNLIFIYCICAVISYIIVTWKFMYNVYVILINKYLLIPILMTLITIGGYLYLSRDLWLIQPLINTIPYVYEGNNTITYNEETGIYTIIIPKDDFKILQLTDIHLGGSFISFDKDVKAIKASYKLIKHTKPDLVVVTGDLTYPVGLSSFSFNNKASVSQFSSFMRNTGVPWVFTYGNHDTEPLASGDVKDLNQLYKSLSWKTSKNLLYPYTQPEANDKPIWGRNNQLIEVRNRDGTLNQALFIIDSNTYVGSGFSKYDYIHDDQVEWYKEEVLRLNKMEGKTISSLVFFHIPLQQYKTAYDLFMKGSSEVKYFFGYNGEKRKEKVCSSKHPSKLFDTAKALNSTKGFFCGHDHYNNISLEYQGIRLTYGMSIDYLVEPGIARDTDQRGATLIVTHKDSNVDIDQVPLISIKDE